MTSTSTGALPPSGRAITTPFRGGRLQIGMAEFKSESVADFIPESVAGLLRNQQPALAIPGSSVRQHPNMAPLVAVAGNAIRGRGEAVAGAEIRAAAQRRLSERDRRPAQRGAVRRCLQPPTTQKRERARSSVTNRLGRCGATARCVRSAGRSHEGMARRHCGSRSTVSRACRARADGRRLPAALHRYRTASVRPHLCRASAGARLARLRSAELVRTYRIGNTRCGSRPAIRPRSPTCGRSMR